MRGLTTEWPASWLRDVCKIERSKEDLENECSPLLSDDLIVGILAETKHVVHMGHKRKFYCGERMADLLYHCLHIEA